MPITTDTNPTCGYLLTCRRPTAEIIDLPPLPADGPHPALPPEQIAACATCADRHRRLASAQ